MELPLFPSFGGGGPAFLSPNNTYADMGSEWTTVSMNREPSTQLIRLPNELQGIHDVVEHAEIEHDIPLLLMLQRRPASEDAKK